MTIGTEKSSTEPSIERCEEGRAAVSGGPPSVSSTDGIEAPADAEITDLPSVKQRESGPRVFGRLANHPDAAAVAREAHALLFRYATEVVLANRLCPFLHNVETGMGAVGVGLDSNPDVDETLRVIRTLGDNVFHLVFPLFTGPSSAFERFGSKLAEALRRSFPEPLVHASFHPDLTGGKETPYRLIGLLRQSPDPFVQFIPPGLQSGGTVMAGEAPDGASHAEDRFARLMGGSVDEVLAHIAELKAERERRYGELARRMLAG
ncbi:MAG: hypothetical protein U0271_18465 [Polyangiaceae bacterium]